MIAINKDKALAQAQQIIKQTKIEALASVKITTTFGNTFDGRDIDQQRMMSAIISSSILDITETQWKLADNSIVTVSLDELKEALALSIQSVGKIVIGE
jgi:predicted DsbA family dithiol-disulfide isomerase